MVIKDVYASPVKISNTGSDILLAPPGDRLMASILDLFLHAPIFTLLSSVILYRLNLLKLTFSTTSEKMAILAQLVWVTVVGTVILQGIYLKLWKKTPGMRLLKLELKSLRSGELTWGQCLLRSTVWCLEIFFLGIPLLEIFSHPKRHTIHDRVSETEIMTRKIWGAIAPLPSERASVQIIFTSVLMLSLGWITALFSMTQRGVQDGSMAILEWRDHGRLCSEIDDVATYSQVDLSNLKDRLDFGLSLFLLDQIDESCLQKELDLAILKDLSGPLVWVGRGLLSPQSSKDRQDYMAKACLEDKYWCQKALFHEKGSLADAKEILKAVKDTKFDETTLAYKTGVLLLVNRLGATDQSVSLIKKLQDQGIRATGLVGEQLKVISQSKPDLVPSVLESLKSMMVEKDYLKLSSELCLRQMESGCGRKVSECYTMASLLPKYKESVEDLTVGRALFKAAVCKQNMAENMEYWTLVSDEGLQKLIRFTLMLEKEDTHSQGLAKLRSFIRDEGQSLELRLDALQILLGGSELEEDWKLASFLWKRFDWTHESFLSASEWLLREGRKEGRQQFILSFRETFSIIPGLRLDWELAGPEKRERLPASMKR